MSQHHKAPDTSLSCLSAHDHFALESFITLSNPANETIPFPLMLVVFNCGFSQQQQPRGFLKYLLKITYPPCKAAVPVKRHSCVAHAENCIDREV